MIPREILKKIRQIELCTNRLVTEFAAGAHVWGENQLVFRPALTCVLSPGRGFRPITLSARPTVRPTNPVAGFFRVAGSVSPSPWGEGRDEGGRAIDSSPAHGHFRPAERENAGKVPFFGGLSRFFSGQSEISVPKIASGKHGQECHTTKNTSNNRGLDFKNMEITPSNSGIDFRNFGNACKNSGNAQCNSVVAYRNSDSASNNIGNACENRGNPWKNGGRTSDIGGVSVFLPGCPRDFGKQVLFA